MELEFELIVKILGGIAGVIASIFAMRKLYKWLFPIYIEPGCFVSMDGAAPDAIEAEVVNRSSETLYVTECTARGTFSFWHILKTHFKNPFVKPGLFQNIWYHGASYNLISGESIKIEAHQPIKLRCELCEHPLNAMYTPYFVVFVKLSSGRTIRSKKMWAPKRWRFIGKNHA